jgi:hypothetical protein
MITKQRSIHLRAKPETSANDEIKEQFEPLYESDVDAGRFQSRRIKTTHDSGQM